MQKLQKMQKLCKEFFYSFAVVQMSTTNFNVPEKIHSPTFHSQLMQVKLQMGGEGGESSMQALLFLVKYFFLVKQQMHFNYYTT